MSKSFSEEFGKLLRLRGISNKELASKIDVHTSQVSNWMTGKIRPSMPNIQKLARELGSDFTNLLKIRGR